MTRLYPSLSGLCIPKTKAPRLSAILALSAALLIAGGCSHEAGEKEPIVSVQVAPVQKTTLQQIVTSEALLYPLAQAAITPKISAPVSKFYVNRGSKVRAGQLLAVLENRDLSAAAQDNKGALEQAQATYETTTAASLPEEIQKASLDVEAAKKLLDAQQKVYTSRQELYAQGAMPRKELDQSAVDLQQAQNQYDISQKHLNSLMAIGRQNEMKSAAGQLQSAKGKYLGAEAQLSYSEIHSPINGVVTDRPLYPGEMTAAGTPLITVMDTSKVIARAHIPQVQATLLKVGDKATITAPGLEEPVDGKITIVSPALDPNSTTVEIWVQANNPKQTLRPGSSVQVAMLAQTLPDALAIPSSALLTASDGGTSVMVAGSDGRAHQQDVKVGIRQGDLIQIAEGLQAGQQVVTVGAYGLPDKTKIKIESPAPAAEKPSAEKPGSKSDEDEKK